MSENVELHNMADYWQIALGGSSYTPKIHSKYVASHPKTVAQAMRIAGQRCPEVADVIAALVWKMSLAENRAEFVSKAAAEARAEAATTHQRTLEALEFDVERLAKERDEAREEVERLRNAPRIEFHQQDWLEGFAAFVENATTPPPESRAFCLLNLGAFLATVEHGHVEKAELPYFVAESMMHEVVHALEQWAGVEFSEERVEALLVKYRAATLTKEPTDG